MLLAYRRRKTSCIIEEVMIKFQVFLKNNRISFIILCLTLIFCNNNAKANESITVDDHTYEIIRGQYNKFTWLRANDSAQKLGGYLAVITSQEEQEIVNSLLQPGDEAWVGGADVVVESKWRWFTGESWSYSNWMTDQPDTAFGMDYLQLIDSAGGQWKSANRNAIAFIVEYECCRGFAGNVDCDPDGNVNIADLMRLIDYIFYSHTSLCCPTSANINGDDNDDINIGDITTMVDFMFRGRNSASKCASPLTTPTDTIILVDRNGREWDISDGVHLYGLDPDSFNFGLGVDAFPPIMFPDILKPGDSGYPTANLTYGVLGVTIDGQSRAYRKSTLRGNEVVNDTIGEYNVAATY